MTQGENEDIESLYDIIYHEWREYMGRFKDKDTRTPIYNWLIEKGFNEESGARGESGLTKVYKQGEIYYVWVTVSFEDKKIYIYKEYDCGGKVDDAAIPIEKDWLKDLDVFIDNVDKTLQTWIG